MAAGGRAGGFWDWQIMQQADWRKSEKVVTKVDRDCEWPIQTKEKFFPTSCNRIWTTEAIALKWRPMDQPGSFYLTSSSSHQMQKFPCKKWLIKTKQCSTYPLICSIFVPTKHSLDLNTHWWQRLGTRSLARLIISDEINERLNLLLLMLLNAVPAREWKMSNLTNSITHILPFTASNKSPQQLYLH